MSVTQVRSVTLGCLAAFFQENLSGLFHSAQCDTANSFMPLGNENLYSHGGITQEGILALIFSLKGS